MTLSVDDAHALVTAALTAAGTTPNIAASVARALVGAQIDGQAGHGLSRVPSYADQVLAGKVDGSAEPVVTAPRSGTVRIDVGHGFAYPGLERATQVLPDLARASGVACAALTRSHHAGALGQVVERLADAGCIALMFANTPAAMTAWGGKAALMGTNPIAFAAPRAGEAAPIVIDLALSHVARGKIIVANQTGETIPHGWAKDAEGAPTSDAAAALKGTLEPAGGAKGAALALMVELLAAALTGGNLASEASPFMNAEGGPPDMGQLILAIDPGAFGDAARTLATIERLSAMIEADPPARLPGANRRARRAAAQRDGLTVNEALLAQLRQRAGW